MPVHINTMLQKSELPTSGILDGSDSGSENEYVPPPPRHPPLLSQPILWDCIIDGPRINNTVCIEALIDDGSQVVLICASLVDQLGLRQYKLPCPLPLSLIFDNPSSPPSYPSVPPPPSSRLSPILSPSDTRPNVITSEWVQLSASSSNFVYKSWTVCAVVAPDTLCFPVVFGGPFLNHNRIVVDHDL